MNIETIRTRLKENFRPFAVIVSSGNKYPVPHPGFIFLTVRTVIVADRKGDTVHLDPLHIAGLEDIRAHKNGGSKHRRGR